MSADHIDIDKLRAELRDELPDLALGIEDWRAKVSFDQLRALLDHIDDLTLSAKHSADVATQAIAAKETAETALTSFQNEVWSSFDKWSQQLGWGLTGAQPECFAMMDAAVAELAKLSDPNSVHVNMLRGTIAKPSWEQIQHLYPEETARLRAPVEGEVGEIVRFLGYREQACRLDGEPVDDLCNVSLSVVDRAADLLQRLAGQLAEATATYTDEDGMVWPVPTSWAYAAVCKARSKHEARATTAEALLREAVEKMTEIMHADEVDDPTGEYCATDEKPLGACGQIARAFISTLKDQSNGNT